MIASAVSASSRLLTKRYPSFDVSEPHVVTNFLEYLALEGKSGFILLIIVATSAAPIIRVALLWLKLRTADARLAYRWAKIRKIDDDIIGIKRRTDDRDALSQLVDKILRLVVVTPGQRADLGSDGFVMI